MDVASIFVCTDRRSGTGPCAPGLAVSFLPRQRRYLCLADMRPALPADGCRAWMQLKQMIRSRSLHMLDLPVRQHPFQRLQNQSHRICCRSPAARRWDTPPLPVRCCRHRLDCSCYHERSQEKYTYSCICIYQLCGATDASSPGPIVEGIVDGCGGDKCNDAGRPSRSMRDEDQRIRGGKMHRARKYSERGAFAKQSGGMR